MLVATDAVVLHVFDSLESSRIIRFATRDAGLVSALARGARRPKSRFGPALDLFTSGVAQLAVRPGRDLQTLTGFDALRARHGIALDLERFTAAAALAELALRFLGDDPNPEAYEALVDALDALVRAAPDAVDATALGGAWHLVGTLGFAPTVDECALCHAAIEADDAVPFAHAAGGVLCARCAARGGGGRPLPPRARAALRGWLSGATVQVADRAEGAAHQRLLRNFLQAHLADGRPLPAFELWEQRRWSAP